MYNTHMQMGMHTNACPFAYTFAYNRAYAFAHLYDIHAEIYRY